VTFNWEEFDEYPTVPTVGAYYKEPSTGEVYRVEHIYFEDREVALTELGSGEEIYTFIDLFDSNYEEIEEEEIEESEIPLYLLANVGVAYG